MDALILSCSTGGGHNTAARAVQEEWQARGHRAVFMDPYSIYGIRLDQKVGNAYVTVAQKAPRLFGTVYGAGNVVRRLPGRSPVYWANGRAARHMEQYLARHTYDVIVTTHLFPGEILTRMKRRGVPVPPTVFVATDYTCIPFTEEIDCEYFAIPSARLTQEYVRRGIPGERIVPCGIPVAAAFARREDRRTVLTRLGLPEDRRYYLICGGSMGAGHMKQTLAELNETAGRRPDVTLLALCGNNDRLYESLRQRYEGREQVRLLRTTDRMADYFKVCDAVLSKPGGLSSTEAAVARVPLIHLAPIPGCETRNRRYFVQSGLSVAADGRPGEIGRALARLEEPAVRERMQSAWRRFPQNAAARVVDLAQRAVWERREQTETNKI